MSSKYLFKKKIQEELVNTEKLSILVTGATGTFGQKFIEHLLEKDNTQRIIVFSRDELKQHEMREKFESNGINLDRLRFFIGDVRDYERLKRAFSKVDIVIHAAALKQVVAAEYNPIECIKTNINGAENIINAAIDCDVKRVIALSTDKAVNPINLYGATKLCSDKLFVSANNLSGSEGTIFSVVRYGNVIGSRGSVIPVFKEQRKTGIISITDTRMTRFWLTINDGVKFVYDCLKLMKGGEVFIPKIPSMKITDLVKVLAPNCEFNVIGVRPGEKIHEIMISPDDALRTVEFPDKYIICPDKELASNKKYIKYKEKTGEKVNDGFFYSSDSNKDWLTVEKMKKIIS
jgi:UDP-N-acetylglucosamine 4,6-dehydratase